MTFQGEEHCHDVATTPPQQLLRETTTKISVTDVSELENAQTFSAVPPRVVSLDPQASASTFFSSCVADTKGGLPSESLLLEIRS